MDNINSIQNKLKNRVRLSDNEKEFMDVAYFLSDLPLSIIHHYHKAEDLEKVKEWFERNKTLLSWDLIADAQNIHRIYMYLIVPGNGHTIFDIKLTELNKRLDYRGISRGINGKPTLRADKTDKNADYRVSEYLNENMKSLHKLFYGCGEDSGYVRSVFLNNKLASFIFIIESLSDINDLFNASVPSIDWIQYNEIKDWLFMNTNKIDWSEIEKYQDLWNRKIRYCDSKIYKEYKNKKAMGVEITDEDIFNMIINSD